MKRRFFAGLIVCVLVISLFTSCNVNSKSLTECGEDVIDLMVEMIESEDYKALYNLPKECDEILNNLRETDYSEFLAIYEISIPEDRLLDSSVKKENFSKDLYNYISSSAYVSFASSINTKSGSSAAIVSSAFAVSKSFAKKNMNENKIYLYVFENGFPIAVSFISDGDGVFRATGNFIINDKFVTDNEDSIEDSCKDFGILGVKAKKQ